MKLSKRQLKQIIREEYKRILRRGRLNEGDEYEDDEIIDSFETETMYITQYANGYVQIEKKEVESQFGGQPNYVDFDSSELPGVVAALQKMELF